MRRQIAKFLLCFTALGFLLYSCGEETTSIRPNPNDREYQPSYTKGEKPFTQDSDNDGVCDYIDFYPNNSEKSFPSIVDEEEFNNNIQDATPLLNNGQFPVIVKGEIARGSNYYIDSDYFRFSAKKGDRLSILVFKGKIDSTNGTFSIQFDDSPWNPRLTILSPNGAKVAQVDIPIKGTEYIKGIGFIVPQDGDYYVEVSDPDTTSPNYNYPYVILIQRDSDFDGLGDGLETLIGSDSYKRDTDEDGIYDFDEVYAFVNKEHGIINYCGSRENSKFSWWDVDGDKIPNWYDVDSDGDGPPDRVEGLADADMDMIPNFLDKDSNGNGIPDGREVGESFKYPVDNDGDGIYDFADIDRDQDMIPDSIDDNIYQPKKSNYVFDNESIIILIARTKLEDTNGNISYIKRVGIVGNELEIIGENLNENLKVLFPTKYGSVAVDPVYDSENDALLVKVPKIAVSGNIYLYDINQGKLSNGYYIDVRNKENSPIILPLHSTLSPGEHVSLHGYNLSFGDVSVVFTNGIETVTVNGVAHGNSVEFTVPQNAVSGVLYVKKGIKETNRIIVEVERNVKISVKLGKGLAFSNTDIKSFADGKEYSLNKNFEAQIPVENNFIDFASVSLVKDFDNDGNQDVALLYESVVLPGQTEVNLNATTTAVKWVFYNLGYAWTQPPSKWKDILNTIENTPEVTDLAEYIDTLLNIDPRAISKFNDQTLIEKFKQALIAASNNVADMLTTKAIEPEIKPSKEQYDISLTPTNIADLKLVNDTKLFCSVEVKTKDGHILRTHITSPWDNNIVEPQWGGLLFRAQKVTLNVGGKDSTIDVITGGWKSPNPQDERVHKYVIFRTVFDGIVIPPLNDFVLKKLLGRKIRSEEIAGILIDLTGGLGIINDLMTKILYTHDLFNPINRFFESFEKTIESCSQLPPGDACQSLAKAIARVAVDKGLTYDKILTLLTKTLGKEIVEHLTPAIGQIKAALDIAGAVNTIGGVLVTVADIEATPGDIKFDVDYPLEIKDVKPSCVNKSMHPHSFFLFIDGKGFTPYQTGHLWWKKSIFPKVTLGGKKGEIYNITPDGTRMVVRFISSEFSDGNYTLKITHLGQEATYSHPVSIYGGTRIQISNLEPNSGKPGDIVYIYGCGFSQKLTDNHVYFTSKQGQKEAEVLYREKGRIAVVVPDDVITGPVFVKTPNAVSNSLNFEVKTVKTTITFGDCGSANDDTFALYVDGSLVYSMSKPSRPFPVNIELTPGKHEVTLLGITAPDDVGTYCISFSDNIQVISGPSLSGGDLTAGVEKKWLIDVSSTKGDFHRKNIENYVSPDLVE